MEQDVALNDASRDPTSSSIVSHFCFMANASKVSPTLDPNKSHDDHLDDNEDEDKDEESDDIASLKIKGEMILKSLYKNKLSCSNFMEIMSIATEGKKYIEELEAHLDLHEATIEIITCVDTNHVEEIKELKAQVTSLKKDLEKSHEGMSTLNNVLCGQKSPNDKGGLGFNSNKKENSKNFKKKGQEQVKNSAKIICFKCKIEGHHVRSSPLKKKPQSHSQQGKRPQVQSHTQLQVEERPLPKKTQDNTPHVEKSIGKKLKGRCCYLCREKGHFASSCTRGTIGDALDAWLTYKEGVDTVCLIEPS
ncbi:hypothetical protein D1007_06858 [Hordeum vulgare]|nr:hypothetical protein D1007_06858 [Hordeum vulgare]